MFFCIENVLCLIFFTVSLCGGSVTNKQLNYRINFTIHEGLKLIDENEGTDAQAMGEETMIVDRPFDEIEEEIILGRYYGEEIGVGLAEGIRCVLERPLGDDDVNYCKVISPKEIDKMDEEGKDLIVINIGEKGSDAETRLKRSASTYQYKLENLEESEWSKQVQKLRDVVQKFNNDKKDKLLLFINGSDAIFTSGPFRIAEEFYHSEAGILISASGIGLGDKETLDQFTVPENGKTFPSAKGFVGTVGKVQELLKEFPEDNDLQNLLNKAYLKPSLRKKFGLKIDHTSHLFQNLNGATSDLEISFIGKESFLQNTVYRSVPVIVISDDEKTKTILNTYGSYLAQSWNPEDGCRECWENMISLEEKKEEEFPMVTLAVFVEKPTPFLKEFLETLEALLYPKKRLHLFVHNDMEYHEEQLEKWFSSVKDEFSSAKYISSSDKKMKEWHAKDAALDFCLERECDFVFFVDSEARLDNPHSLKLLVEQNRKVVAPMLIRPGKAWSNFWGALTSDGFYARSEDYMDIVKGEKRGLWNVPYVGSSFLVKRSLIEDPKTKPSFINNLLDSDMAFSANLREKGIFLYVSNRMDFGHLVNSDNFNIRNFHPDLWQMFDNRWDWERAYLHENYSQSLNESNKIQMPCPDVYWFPVFTERYAKEMIEMVENYGKWSDGSHMDTRLESGYENVPTVDIHMKQVNYNDEWHEILRAYIQPLQLRVYDGYFNDVGPPRALMSFTVRYRPDEQPALRPHHDTSTYTINVGLNRPGIDYQGGGCRFLRYNCSVVDTRVGWTLMHPGRLTHLHEGLRVTDGTRYIIVTFVDP